MRLYDTERRAVVAFEPDELVKIYTCGITPYDSAHVGHAATYIYYDVLQRRLRDLGHRTQTVRNITDIDEPLFAKARELGVDWKQLGDREVEKFSRAMQALGLLPAFSEPRATGSIPDVLGFIGILVERGHAYVSESSVYFSARSMSRFGRLAGLNREEMLSVAAERGGNVEDPNKDDPLDFVLWQPSAVGEPSWPSMWGNGRPGWHIECSALAMRELGESIDLHGGGSDLIFPHHECEAAQSEAATGREFVRHWMHVAMVELDGEKMSKSLGNLVFVDDLLKQWGGEVIRVAILDNHYRLPWEWRDAALPDAAERIERWRHAGPGEGALEEVRAALDEDLDTVSAMSAIDRATESGKGVSDALALLGLRPSGP